MPIYTDWTVHVGGFDGATGVTEGVPDDAVDFTSRVRSLTVDQQVELAALGRASATITLGNDDGALTPGGGGTYQAFDWFAQPVCITGRYGTSSPPSTKAGFYPFFTGVIHAVKFSDDSFDSTLTLECLDWRAFMARWTRQTASTFTAQSAVTVLVGYIWDVSVMPKFGATNRSMTARYQGPFDDDYTGTVAIGDYANDAGATLIASEAGFTFPATIEFATDDTNYFQSIMPRNHLNNKTAADTEVKFRDTSSALGDGEVPFRNLRLGWTTDDLVTQAVCNRVGGTASTAYDNTLSQTYGPRSIEYTNLYNVDDTATQALADWWTTRFDTVEFTATGLEITGGMIESHSNTSSATQAVVNLLMGECGFAMGILYARTSIEWTGAGSTSNTAQVLPIRVRLSARPDDWVMRLDVKPMATYGGFRLDDTIAGVLDTNRLG